MVLSGKHSFAYSSAPYQCVVACGTVPQAHTVICASGQEIKAIISEAQAVHTSIMGRVH